MRASVFFLGLATTARCLSVPFEKREGVQPVPKLEWSGALYHGGPVVNYSGEGFDDIDAQVQRDYPGLSIYGAPGSGDDDDVSSAAESPEAIVERELLTRQSRKWICNGRFGYGDGFKMNDVWIHLHKVGGQCRVGRRSCVRVYCAGSAGAILCNDSGSTVTLPCKQVGDDVRDIGLKCAEVHDCGIFKPKPCKTRVGGQVFSASRAWNVIAASCPARAGWSW